MSQTKPQDNAARFRADLSVLHRAGVGVILVRTSEMVRAKRTVAEWAQAKDLPFKTWNFRDGWVTPSLTGTGKTERDGSDPFGGMKRILDIDGNGMKPWAEGVYVMAGLEVILDKVPGIVWCLRDYAVRLAETGHRLLLLSPEGYTLPAELQQDIPVLDFDRPARGELRDALDTVVESAFPEGTKYTFPFDDAGVDEILAAAAGLTSNEAETAFAKAIIENADFPATSAGDFSDTVLKTKTEAVRRSEVLELMRTEDIENVAGMDQLKAWLYRTKEAMTPEARDFGIDRPKGILAVGMPGTGKSLVGKATASLLGLPFIRVDIGRFFAGIVGQSEERARSAMKQLDAMAPCVAFVDEVDKGLGGAHNSGGDSGVTKRVLGTILTHMQESDAGIFWIFTANRTDALPPELVRKGRLDEIWNIAPPNDEEREAIIRIHLAKRKQDPDAIGDMDCAVGASEGYVGAEIEAAVKEAIKEAFVSGGRVTAGGIAAQLGYMKPMSVAFPDEVAAMRQWAEANARPASSPTGSPKGQARRRRVRPGGQGGTNPNEGGAA